MATKTSILLLDDLDGSEAAGTVNFSLDGQPWTIDLNAAHSTHLRESLAPYVAAARKVTSGKATRTTRRRGEPARVVSVVAPQVKSTTVREWAKAQGIEVKERGRVPAELYDRYHAANNGK